MNVKTLVIIAIGRDRINQGPGKERNEIAGNI